MTASTDRSALLEDYRSFERGVMQVMAKECAPHCSVCPTPCCRTAICREAEESPFLRAVHGSREAFDAKAGYLGRTGCKLTVGRPPLCHAFLCHRIMEAQPDDQRRYALDVLGELVGYLGKKVWRKRHLVEAMDDADLDHINTELFHQRLTTATAAMEVLEPYLAGESELSPDDLELLASIKPPR